MYYPTAERTLDVLQVLLDSDIEHPVNAGQILKRTNINGTYKKGGRKGIYASILLIMMFFKNIFRAKHMKDGWYWEHPYTTAEVLMTADVTDSLRCAPLGDQIFNGLVALDPLEILNDFQCVVQLETLA